jgi:hypothetical protein
MWVIFEIHTRFEDITEGKIDNVDKCLDED